MGTIRKKVGLKFSGVRLVVIQKHIFARGYPLKKIQENNEVEILQVVLDEARSSYPDLPVVELQSEGSEQLESNVARIVNWIQAWKIDHSEEE